MTIDRRTLMLGAVGATLAARAAAVPPPGPLLPEPDEWIDLWPGEGPGAPPSPPEEMRERSTDPAYNDRALFHIRRPRVAVFRPPRPNGASLLIIPGGSYARVVVDKEGYESARWFAARGITAFVLFYRLAFDHWPSGAETSIGDARQAMRLVRRRAPAGGKVAILGFSAGGHVAADLVARFAPDGRPEAAGLLYPVIAMSGPAAHLESRLNLLGPNATPDDERLHTPALNVTAQAPPCFLVHAEDDPVIPIANTLMMREALRARGVSTETHLFPDGGHGFGIRLAQGHGVAIWPDLFFAWGQKQGLWS